MAANGTRNKEVQDKGKPAEIATVEEQFLCEQNTHF